MSAALLRVGRVIASTRAEGPGTRFAVWVQGCAIRCHGCFNPHLWTTRGGTDIAVGDLASQALAAGVDGVTLLGGEPFDQSAPTAAFARLVQQQEQSVMVFTGYELQELRTRADPAVGRLLANTDLLVDGRYEASQPDVTRPWVGSTNQNFHFLTATYRHLEPGLTSLPDRIEVRVNASGEVSVNGWAPEDALERLVGGLRRSRNR